MKFEEGKTDMEDRAEVERTVQRLMTKRERLLSMDADAYLYYCKLEAALHLIPKEPPRHLTEKHYLSIKALAQVIINRGHEAIAEMERSKKGKA